MRFKNVQLYTFSDIDIIFYLQIYIVKVTAQEHCKKSKVKNAGKLSKAAKKPDRDSNPKQRSKRATTPEVIDMKTPPELLPESPKSEAAPALPYKFRKRA